MKDKLVDLIVARFETEKERLKTEFNKPHSLKIARHFALDEVLPDAIAREIYAQFPKPSKMHLMSSPGKIRLKYSHLKDVNPLLREINQAIQDPRVVAMVEEITGIKNQIPDPTRFAGGISTLMPGYFINPHLDNSHDIEVKRYYRTVNILYYVSPDWCLENGGNYELWDESIENHLVVPSLFNRIIVMETNQTSWHAVNPVLCDKPRCCVFNYYFSEQSPEGIDYFFNHSSFKARPEQRFRRAIEGFKKRLFGK